MSTFIEINDTRYPAVVNTKLEDRYWNNREVKLIHISGMTAQEAAELFVNNAAWAAIEIETVVHTSLNENGETIYESSQEEIVTLNNEYSIAGEIVDHRDGTITVKMGKPTAEELLQLFEEVL